MLSSLKNRGKGNAFFLIDKCFASEIMFCQSCFYETEPASSLLILAERLPQLVIGKQE